MKDFRKLVVWQKSHHLALEIYHLSDAFPVDERYGLISQIRRASMSIPTNIAEGCGYDSDAAFCRYLQIAMGSASEVEYQLLLARDLEFITQDVYYPVATRTVEVKRMLAGFIKKLKSDSR